MLFGPGYSILEKDMITIRCGDKCAYAQNTATLLDAILAAGVPFDAPCGGTGRCGKCLVRLVSGRFVPAGENGGAETSMEDGLSVAPGVEAIYRDGMPYARACRTAAVGDAVIALPAGAVQTDGGMPDEPAAGREPAGPDGVLAVDLGTTTIEAQALTGGGAVCGTFTVRNPLASYGADVMSRITGAARGEFARMHRLTLSAVVRLARAAGAAQVMAVGNTVSLHFLCGADPTPMGQAPFAPAFTAAQAFGSDGLFIRTLPCLSAFVGADALAGAAYCRLADGDMLVDLGTNCEIVLRAGNRYYAGSAPAGPALEGAGIECGSAGIAGAVNAVRYDRGLRVSVIGGGPAVSLCGSGLIDAVAYMRAAGLADETGRMDDALGGTFRLCGKVYVTQKDVRAFQLAKAAVRAAVGLVCRRAGIALPRRILLAGNMGLRVNTASAVAVGLLPDVPVECVGNAALDGCVRAARDEAFRAETERLTGQCVSVGTDAAFDRALVACTALKPM